MSRPGRDLLRGPPCDRPTSDVASDSPTQPCFQSGGHWGRPRLYRAHWNIWLNWFIDDQKGRRSGRIEGLSRRLPRRWVDDRPVQGISSSPPQSGTRRGRVKNESRRRKVGADHRGGRRSTACRTSSRFGGARRRRRRRCPRRSGHGSGLQGAVSLRGPVRLER
jgi:hypothetical protein